MSPNRSLGARKSYPLRVDGVLWDNLEVLYEMDCRKVSKVSFNKWLQGILVDYADGRRDDLLLEVDRVKRGGKG